MTHKEEYNGPRTKLMDDLKKEILEHIDLDLNSHEWPSLEIYVARACYGLEQKGWHRFRVIDLEDLTDV